MAKPARYAEAAPWRRGAGAAFSAAAEALDPLAGLVPAAAWQQLRLLPASHTNQSMCIKGLRAVNCSGSGAAAAAASSGQLPVHHGSSGPCITQPAVWQ